MRLRTKKGMVQALRYVIVIVGLLFFFFPIAWISLTAFKTGDEFMKSPPVWFPRTPTLASFKFVIEAGGLKALQNSFIIAGGATILALLLGSMAAYGLARYKIGGDDLPFFFLSQRFMPPVAVIFPFLLILKTLNWMDSYQALIILYLTFNLPYVIWMMRGFFIEIPIEMEEAAMVDGCSPLQAFWHIALPLAAPGLIATGVFCFIFSWIEFFFAVTTTRRTAIPMSVFLTSFFGPQQTQWGAVGASSFIAMVPMLILSLFVQRYLVRGLTMGAVK